MHVLGESWCFCNGGAAKSEKTKAALFSGKGPVTARISCGGGISGTGFFIHRNLLLTTHANLPSSSAVQAAEIWLKSGVGASLVPRRFFISSSVLDLTIVGVDAMDGDSNTHYFKTCSKPNLELGSFVYLLGYTETNELTVGEGKVVIDTDNLIKISTHSVTLSSGSAGFDVRGNLAFMVCDPMKLATSPNTKSTFTSSSSSTSSENYLSMQFGIPIPIIFNWLNQHWEDNLDEINKPKLPIFRLVSSGQKSENTCASFTMRRVFKLAEPRDEGTPYFFSNPISKTKDGFGDETTTRLAHVQGIPTPEIYESRKLISVLVRKKDTSLVQLLDLNFPPKLPKHPLSSNSIKKLPPFSDENYVKKPLPSQPPSRKEDEKEAGADMAHADVASTGSVSRIECTSEGETTMYSAETAESRNYPRPRDEKLQQMGRSHSCVNYNRWGAVQKYPLARKAVLEKQRSFMQGRKVHSQGSSSQRSNNDYYTPTVSSIMKKRPNSVQRTDTGLVRFIHLLPGGCSKLSELVSLGRLFGLFSRIVNHHYFPFSW